MATMGSKGYSLALAFAAILVAITPGQAKKLYKYQDEQGRWHYTDVKPKTEQRVESRQLRVNPSLKVRLQRRGPASAPEFYIYNDYYGPVQVAITLARGRNVQANPPLPRRFVIPGQQWRQGFTLAPVDPQQDWVYRLHQAAVPGRPEPQHQPGAGYQPPVPRDQTFTVAQGFNGSYSHQDTANRYAVDIAMAKGTPVRAARGGQVMAVRQDFFTHGTEPRHAERANVIRILHPDGTMGVYAHLRLESARVSPGMHVEVGQVIAESGNTGFSTGPHLHFAVQRNGGMVLEAVPFRFRTAGGRAVEPRQGMTLTGY